MVGVKNRGDVLENNDERSMVSNVLESTTKKQQQVTQLGGGIILVQIGQGVTREPTEV